MKRRDIKKIISLSSLYLNYIFQKSTIIIFSVSLALMVFAIIFIANPAYDRNQYFLSINGFHEKYFTQSLFVLGIFNGIFVATVVILLFLQSNSFDSLFLSNTKRNTLVSSKVISSFILFLLMSLFEFILLFGIPLFLYPSYKMEYTSLLTILYLFISMVFDYSISIVLVILVPTIFSPMVILFLSTIKNMVVSAFTNLKDILAEIIPILSYTNSQIEMKSIYIIPLFSLLLLAIYYSCYNIKDIRI